MKRAITKHFPTIKSNLEKTNFFVFRDVCKTICNTLRHFALFCRCNLSNVNTLIGKWSWKIWAQKNVTDSRRFVKFLLQGKDHKSAFSICRSIIKDCIGCNPGRNWGGCLVIKSTTEWHRQIWRKMLKIKPKSNFYKAVVTLVLCIFLWMDSSMQLLWQGKQSATILLYFVSLPSLQHGDVKLLDSWQID